MDRFPHALQGIQEIKKKSLESLSQSEAMNQHESR
jgi:hypothetical protein